MSEIKISEIQVVPIKPKDGLVGFASCVINNQLYLGNIAIYTSPSSPEGFRLVYPLKILKNGTKVSIVHPINKEIGSMLQKQIVEEYSKIMENLTKGDSQNAQTSQIT